MTSALANDWPRYEVYGISIATQFEFANRLLPTDRVPDLSFATVDSPPIAGKDWGPPVRSEAGQWALHRVANTEVLHFVEEADFFISPGRIDCYLPNPAKGHIVEIRLLGGVLAYWLERQGVVALHAAAIVTNEQAVGFVAGNGGGKSSLSAELMRRGHHLLTDDILAVDLHNDSLRVFPGYPQMRMWPREAEHFLGNPEGFSQVHPSFAKLRVPVGADGVGPFRGEPANLGALYFLTASDDVDGLAFHTVPPREALVLLARACFAAPLAGSLPNQADRLRVLGAIASQVPIRTLMLPPGSSRSPEVADAVLDDLARHSSRHS